MKKRERQKTGKLIIKKGGKFWPSKEMKKISLVNESIYEEGKNPKALWNKLAKELFWYKRWTRIYEEKLPNFNWFIGGKTNLCYNAVDKHIKIGKGDKTALIWIPEPTDQRPLFLSYSELQEQIIKFANILTSFGLKKGDVVMIYLPMIPQTLISMLACTRLGIIHSVVFSAFSSESLKKRIKDCEPKLLITADGYYRRGKTMNLKKNVGGAIKGTNLKKVIFVKRLEKSSFSLRSKPGKKYYWWYKLMQQAEETRKTKTLDSECVPLDSKDILFILYTSGTTGTPKGIMHSNGGYLVKAYWTTKLLFNLREEQENIIWCTADIGWITGHTYTCYGPLLNGATTIIYEGSPDWPSFNRFYDIIEKQKVNVFYTAPTLLRMLMAKTKPKYRFKSLRILGTVGEPIDKATWLWYFKNIGKRRCPLLDTWWQTETGGILISSLPGIGPFIPCVTGRSFPGIRHSVVSEKGKRMKTGKKGFLIQNSPFAPGMLTGVWKNKRRYRKQYWSQIKGKYFTGDGAFQDKQGNFRITGRVDDVLKVAGHRMSTAEIENAINKNKKTIESAIIGKADKIKGEVPVAFVVVKPGTKIKKSFEKKLQKQVMKAIGPIVKISGFYFVSDLPKTRSGKIMRRILKNLMLGEKITDTSTLVNPQSVKEIEGVLKGK